VTEPRNVGKQWEKCLLWQALSLRQGPDAGEVRATVTLCLKAASEILDKAETAAKDFTLHDSDHSFRVAENMVKIVPKATLDGLSFYELAFLLLSAYLHDIGMHPDRSRITAHYEFLLSAAEGLLTDREALEFQEWLDRQADAVVIPLCKVSPTIDQLRKARELITYYCRARHNDWSADWIKGNLAPYPLAGYIGWLDDLITLCKSHHEGYKDLLGDKFDPRLVGPDVIHLRYLAAVLRVADILDVDPERTPGIILRHRNIADKSVIYWHKDQHLRLDISASEIGAYARPTDARLHKAIDETVDAIDAELETCFSVNVEKTFANLPSSLNRKLVHSWTLPRACLRNIAPKDGAYEYVNGAFRPDTNKLLQLLSGVELYGSELAASRELLQNAFDAIQIQMGLERLGHSDALDQHYLAHLTQIHEVALSLDVVDGEVWLTCTDTGAGMSKKIIEGYLLVSGSRRPPETIELARRCNRAGFSLETTAEFGIGVLSYFMLADRIVIRTVRSREASMGATEACGWRFETEGVGSFGELRREPSIAKGTEVRLLLRSDIVGRRPEEFWARLSEYLVQTLRRVPCRFILKSSASGAAEWRVGPGWTMSEDSLVAEISEQLRSERSSGDVPSELVPDRDREEIQAEESHFGELRHLVCESMRFIEESGVLPEKMGNYRIRVPYFDLPGGASGAFLRCAIGPSGGNAVEMIGKGFSFVPKGMIRHSWKGMGFGRPQYYSYHSRLRDALMDKQHGVVEIDWTSSEAGTIAVNRSAIDPSEKVESALSWIENRKAKLCSEFVLRNASSQYALLNTTLLSAELPDSSATEWLQVSEGNRTAEWKPIHFPATTSLPFIYANLRPLRWNNEHISVLPCLQEYDDAEHYKGATFISRATPPDRVCKLDGFWFAVAPIWSSRPIVKASEDAFTTSRFPPEWQHLCGAHFSHYTSSESADVWNADNPLVKAVGPTQWRWCTERFKGTHNPLLFRREILSDPGLATGWLFWCLAKSHVKIWEGTRDRDPQFMQEVWEILRGVIGDRNWVGDVYHWVESVSESRLRILTYKSWGALNAPEGRNKKRIESILPQPETEWRLIFPIERPPQSR